jgi:hypothetical protein
MAGRDVGIVFADELNHRYLGDVAASTARGGPGACQVSFSVRSRISARVMLVAYQGAVKFLTGIDGNSRADDIRWTFSLRSVTGLDYPLELNRLKVALKATQQRPFNEQGGAFTKQASEIVLRVVIDHQRALGPLLDELLALRNVDLPEERRVKFAQERDGVASLFSFTGFPGLIPDGGLLSDSEAAELSSRDSFLPETQSGIPLEDPMVEHDANTFLGWSPTDSDKLGVRAYTDGAERELKVMSVNRWAIETRLGPDLIYYHVQRRSFVLVQYKRMIREGRTWRYRVDDDFRSQLKVMRELDDRCRRTDDDGRFRLVPTPSFVKVCRLDDLDIDSLSMVSGMCMPREQVEAHLARPNTPQTFEYDAVRDYMTSTLFALLIANGYFGTSGASSELVKKEIDSALNRRGSVLVGAFSDTSGQRPSWRTSASKGRLARRSEERYEPDEIY